MDQTTAAVHYGQTGRNIYVKDGRCFTVEHIAHKLVPYNDYVIEDANADESYGYFINSLTIEIFKCLGIKFVIDIECSKRKISIKKYASLSEPPSQDLQQIIQNSTNEITKYVESVQITNELR